MALRSWPASRAKAAAFMASTGNTQGIRFRIRPPSKANSSACDQRQLLAAAGARPDDASSARQRDRAWPRRRRPAGPSPLAGLLGQRQRCRKGSGGQGSLGVAALQGDADALGVDAGRLLGHGGDRSPVGREEVDIADGRASGPWPRRLQGRIARLGDAVARRPRALIGTLCRCPRSNSVRGRCRRRRRSARMAGCARTCLPRECRRLHRPASWRRRLSFNGPARNRPAALMRTNSVASSLKP